MPELIPADQIEFEAFLKTFNTAYSDYFVPLHLEAEPMRKLIQRDGVDLSASQVALENGEPVGVGMLAIRGKEAWIGGLGVVPDWRGKKVGRLLMDGLIESAKQRGIIKVNLEVIEENTVAHNLYLSMGFEEVRRLEILQRQPRIDDLDNPEGYSIEEWLPEQIYPYYPLLHQAPNPWQRRLEALRTLQDNLEGWVIRKNQEVVAYALGWATPEVLRWMDLAALPNQEKAMTLLVAHVHDLVPFATGSIVNMPANDPLKEVLYTLGYQKTRGQLEMVLSPLP